MIHLHEPLYEEVIPLEWERQLFQTSYVKRLKHLAHFGAGSFVSSVTHSRYEHTIGVWKLVVRFFPQDDLLRAAAILHDIGHLPFSHAVERTLGYDHHLLTNTYINSDEVDAVLQTAKLSASEVCTVLNKETALTGTSQVLGLDHLDSFLRDTYMAGTLRVHPKEIVDKLTCSHAGIESDEATATQLLEIIEANNRLIHSPLLRAVDFLLAQAVDLHWQETRDGFSFLMDAEVTAQMIHSPNKEVRRLIQILLFEPHRIVIESGPGDRIRKGKVYSKQPLVNGTPYSKTEKGKAFERHIQALVKEYDVRFV
ncbi:HD domain-containing protein [Shouchella patagoniensis]|uniref:HD domain-containing protein n=1 Tax=Shouchella patagoniensis TaxID=228576 RepID=UPI000995DE47|nr:HD domain-containing protein [Shouchella patagoniensis]